MADPAGSARSGASLNSILEQYERRVRPAFRESGLLARESADGVINGERMEAAWKRLAITLARSPIGMTRNPRGVDGALPGAGKSRRG